MTKEFEKIIEFLHFARKLKHELRHSWGADGRRESVAEHSWRIALMAMMLSPHLKKKIDIEKTLKMLIIHDIIEAESGDVLAQDYQYSKTATKDKENKEKQAIEHIKRQLNSKTGVEIYDLWNEFEKRKTYEAKVAVAMDKMEIRLQHVEDPVDTWSDQERPRALFAADKYCDFDETTRDFNELIKKEAKEKLKKAGYDIHVLRKQAEKLKKKIVKS